MTDSFTMPIIGTSTRIIWRPTEADQVRAMTNHGGQSLAKLASRGGVDWTELDAILADEPFSLTTRDEASSCKRVHLILRQRAESKGLNMTDVECVARAMLISDHQDPEPIYRSPERLCVSIREQYERRAKAAIAAIAAMKPME